MLCADLVKVEWRDKLGGLHSIVANLEDISLSGACLQIEEDIPLQTVVSIVHANGGLQGRVRYCVFKEIGYFLGVEFDPGYRWNAREFRPMHLLDPRRLERPKTEVESKEALVLR
jgi:hypothetical protein